MKDFIDQFNGSSVDFDHTAGSQCVDLAKLWLSFLGYEVSGTWGNAKDWDKHGGKPDLQWIANTPSGIPLEGDLVVWGNGTYGHIAIFIEGNTNRFTSFDQNYPVGSTCHIQEHNYSNVKGWLRPLKYGDKMIDQNFVNGELYRTDSGMVLWHIPNPDVANRYFHDWGNTKPISDIVPQLKELADQITNLNIKVGILETSQGKYDKEITELKDKVKSYEEGESEALKTAESNVLKLSGEVEKLDNKNMELQRTINDLKIDQDQLMNGNFIISKDIVKETLERIKQFIKNLRKPR